MKLLLDNSIEKIEDVSICLIYIMKTPIGNLHCSNFKPTKMDAMLVSLQDKNVFGKGLNVLS